MGNLLSGAVFHGFASLDLGIIDASGEKSAVVFVAPESGTIDRAAIAINAASSVQDLVTTIEGVDATGNPDGSAIDTSAAWTPAASTWGTATFATGAAVTAGTRYAAVTTFSGTIGNVQVFAGWAQSNGGFPAYVYPSSFASAAWTQAADAFPVVAVRYTDEVWRVPLGCWPFAFFNGDTLNSSNNEVGYSFTPANDGTFSGAIVTLSSIDSSGDANESWKITLYDTDGSSELASVTTNSAALQEDTVERMLFPFGYQALTGGSTYYLGIKGTGTSPLVVRNHVAASDVIAAIAFGGLTDCAPLTRPNGGGSWSSDTTYPAMVPLISETVGAAVADVYHADVNFTRDTTNSRDEYTVVWYKNGVPQTSGVTSPTIQIINRSDGSDLVASTAMSEAGSSHVFTYNHSSLAVTAGEAVVVHVAATIDSSSRTFRRVVSRDP